MNTSSYLSNENPITNETNQISDIYDEEIEYLKTQLTRIDNRLSIQNFNKHNFQQLSNKLLNESEERETFFNHLKDEFKRVNPLVSEANTISNEMQRQTSYSVILNIPISYLKPSERAIANLCEIAVQVKRRDLTPQIWNTEKFELKLNDMREIYQKWQTSEMKKDLLKEKRNDSFFDVEESNSLIGVANIYLKGLLYDSKLDYIVPIINTQGEKSGTLQVILVQNGLSSMKKLSDLQKRNMPRGSRSEGISLDTDAQSINIHSNSQMSLEDEGIDDSTSLFNAKNDEVSIKFAIKEVRDLPESHAESVMCRYTFINPKLDQTILSQKPSDDDIEHKSGVFSFNHEQEYTFPITDDFLSTCLESAVSIEVWYQYNSIPQAINTTENNEHDRHNAEVQAISKRWKEVKRHIQCTIEICELDASGQWRPVEIDVQPQINSGGIYRLKQGQSKRLAVHLRVLPRSDSIPLVFDAIRSIEIGSISTRKIDAPRQLDSYQDEELQYLREKWLESIGKRKAHLESEINQLNQQTNGTSIDTERENILLEQLVRLAEERNIAMFPPTSSGIPGAPAHWTPPPTIEIHRPLICLNLDTNTSNEPAGSNAILHEETQKLMFPLSLIHHASNEARAVAQWDPSIHEAAALDQVTPHDTLIYMIVKITVIISQPVRMELVLRKRIAVSIGKTDNWWLGKPFKNLLGYKGYKRTSVVYEIISHIPKYMREIEDGKNSLLRTNLECLEENDIEKCIRYASAIDSLLLLDKLRQEVLLAENSAKQKTIRKATSVPNITHEKRNTILLRKSHQENVENPSDTPNETTSSSSQLEINISSSDYDLTTPTMISRSLFIEQEQLKPIQTSTIRIPHSIDLDDNNIEDNENTLEQRYSIVLTPQRIDSPVTPRMGIGSRVIVNTGHHILDRPGIIHFIGDICIKEGIWYGIALEPEIGTEKEFLGKNNGSLNGHIYFECLDNQGVFVRRDKIRLANSN